MSLKFFIPALVWSVVIFLAISLPAGAIPKTGLLKIPHFDKIIHALMFFILAVFLSFGFFKQSPISSLQKNYFLLAILTGIIYGAATEGFQYFWFSSRHGNFYDFFANAFGTVFGVILFANALKPRIKKSLPK